MILSKAAIWGKEDKTAKPPNKSKPTLQIPETLEQSIGHRLNTVSITTFPGNLLLLTIAASRFM